MCVSSSFGRLFSKMEHLFTPPIQCYILQFIIQVNCLIIASFCYKGNSLCVRNSTIICSSVWSSFVYFVQSRPTIEVSIAKNRCLFTVIPSILLRYFSSRDFVQFRNQSMLYSLFYHLAHIMCVADHLRSRMKSESLSQSYTAWNTGRNRYFLYMFVYFQIQFITR